MESRDIHHHPVITRFVSHDVSGGLIGKSNKTLLLFPTRKVFNRDLVGDMNTHSVMTTLLIKLRVKTS